MPMAGTQLRTEKADEHYIQGKSTTENRFAKVFSISLGYQTILGTKTSCDDRAGLQGSQEDEQILQYPGTLHAPVSAKSPSGKMMIAYKEVMNVGRNRTFMIRYSVLKRLVGRENSPYDKLRDCVKDLDYHARYPSTSVQRQRGENAGVQRLVREAVFAAGLPYW
ncbi:hypothetical protein ARMGADRAFT_1038044 [Armillaria gallica]|uniref:Uncharacterized protein n=1 Tax=Armillaria gallica TaxID=47427 RepID=A0A2H3CN19_ARMGA|nr:hypothetical protein ARMGADRAFT_1038044 [Armillaria gallica]